ncbi:mitochondrial inner membrane protease ATP23 homolog isoform X2 [Corticium candelabrum]|uniref:mitochondrial inner membrane protease ATP23 homolog isoform X2 n=1 Tax=Corticium candelabrum TaxID=121492 RepID=UPI002E267BB7|nr:mitochondrial inner membrane protease ATP23 homolog isoform X2 [Corticium candelabrum]
MFEMEKQGHHSVFIRTFHVGGNEEVGEVNMKRHLVCEPCSGRVLGGFDHRRQQIVLCENTIYSETCMSEVLTHELIHAYDFCRYNTNFSDVKHLACSEIRAANLSGDCFFWKENFGRFKFGWKKHQQACVRERAVNSILCVKDIEKSEAENVVDSVFASCFYNTEPFEHVPP